MFFQTDIQAKDNSAKLSPCPAPHDGALPNGAPQNESSTKFCHYPVLTPNFARPLAVTFFGLPGSGKGTQAARVAGELGVKHLSTGDYFRDQIARKTPQGMFVQSFIAQGEMVPDEFTVDVVRELLASQPYRNGVVLDGFPRTANQARILETMLKELGYGELVAVELGLEESVARERMKARAASSVSQRCDDVDAVFSNRLAVYRDEMPKMREYYASRGIATEVSSLGPIDDVYRAVWGLIEPRLPKRISSCDACN